MAKARQFRVKIVTGTDASNLEANVNAWLAQAGEKELIEIRWADQGGNAWAVLILYAE